MTSRHLTYAIVSPVRDEQANLGRLAESLLTQSRLPDEWLIVDNGSTDATPALASELAAGRPWIRAIEVPGDPAVQRGGAIVRAFELGVAQLRTTPDVVVKVDADVSMGPDHFERLLAAFATDARLGIASGSAYEERDGVWRQRHVTRTSVWGACRAYRRECLREVSPLEQRIGWDGLDELKANVRGWKTATLVDLPFRHHRREGERDGASGRAWAAQGRAAHYMDYRPSYLLLRVLHHARRDPAAVMMLWGYVAAWAGREPRYADLEVRAYLRGHQTIRRLSARTREALGRQDRRVANPVGRK